MKKIAIFSVIITASSYSISDTLDEIVVTTNNLSAKKSSLNTNQLKKGLLMTEKDFLRNETGIVITEGGRTGNNGFAIRGVDSDRVSIDIDGITAVESFMPKFYYEKGFHNGNRNSTEIENLSNVAFTKGANSLTKGSGAIGGSVAMQTKTIRDFVANGDKLGLYSKLAYNSKNEQFTKVVGIGSVYNGFETLLQYTHKTGKENKNYYSKKVNDIDFCGYLPINSTDDSKLFDSREKYPELCSFGRILPDSVENSSKSILFKAGYHFNDSHFLNTFYETMARKYNTEEKSNSIGAGRKRSEDSIPYSRIGLIYEYTPSNHDYLNYLKVQLAKQKVIQQAKGYQYGVGASFPDFPDWIATWNKIDTERNNTITQKRWQLDTKFISNDFNINNTEHVLSGGAGIYFGSLDTENSKRTLTYNPASEKLEKYTIQQPVRSTISYLYLKDNVRFNDKLNLNFGTRLDHYTYKPKKSSLPYEDKNQSTEKQPSKRFSAVTYQAGMEYAITPDISLNYAFSTGFKAPKIEEMYFKMQGSGDLSYSNNLNLKPEKAINHEIGFTLQNNYSALSLNAFYSKYRDFMDYSYNVETESYQAGWGKYKRTEYRIKNINYQQDNIDSATIKGIEFNSKVTGKALNLPNELFAIFKATYTKGTKSDGTSLMAISPFTAILGLGYDGKAFDIQLNARMVAAKKAKDTIYQIPPNSLQVDIDKKTGEIQIPDNQPKPFPFLSSGYTVFDLTASYKINQNFSIYGGIFNLFDKKYSTWENLRQLKHNGNQSWVKNTGEGLERYTDAGRNFAISIEARY